jgi:hypothetical protein
MDSILTSVVTNTLFMAANYAVGTYLLHKKGRPFAPLKLGLHLLLFFFIISGVAATIAKLQVIDQPAPLLPPLVYGIGAAVLMNLVTGTMMAFAKDAKAQLSAVHRTSTFVMIALSLVCGAVIVMV